MSLEDEGRLRKPERSLQVDDLRVAHFMSIVRENKHFAEVFDAASSRMVLLLGRFKADQGAILDALKDFLPRFGYAPVVFDFREPRDSRPDRDRCDARGPRQVHHRGLDRSVLNASRVTAHHSADCDSLGADHPLAR